MLLKGVLMWGDSIDENKPQIYFKIKFSHRSVTIWNIVSTFCFSKVFHEISINENENKQMRLTLKISIQWQEPIYKI